MKRGFKASAERRSLAERDKLGLTATCRLDPISLAASKGIEVFNLSALPGVPPHHLERLQVDDSAAFSACTVVHESSSLIVVNDAHTPARRANSVAHEMAHVLLEHKPSEAFDGLGSRQVTKEMEDEADWLAGCLLVPGSGIPSVMNSADEDLPTAAAHYGVSVELMRWRYNMTQKRRRT